MLKLCLSLLYSDSALIIIGIVTVVEETIIVKWLHV